MASAPNISDFELALGVKFKDPKLLQQAFVHRSYLNENRHFGLPHNERLEFLGDAVLELVTTEHLYGRYPEKNEGELTNYRAALVNTVNLARVGTAMGMNDYLLLSRGEAKDNGRARQVILANTFESLIGAIYLDQGYDAAKRLIENHLFPNLEEVISGNLQLDAKSLFQERAQASVGLTPRYEVESESGPDHNKVFTVALFVGNEKVTEGTGRSKQEAEQEAARRGLDRKYGTNQ